MQHSSETKRPSSAERIELRLDKPEHLFDPFDPLPLPTRDLSRAAEEFIVGWARDLPSRAPMIIALHVPVEFHDNLDPNAIQRAIAGHFQSRAERMRGDVRELLRIGQASLLIGLTVLAVCTGARQLIAGLLPDTPLSRFSLEGLVIFGWVANWRPIEIFLYDWWPIARRRRLFTRLAAATIEIVPEGADRERSRVGPAAETPQFSQSRVS
jgi:hypothetical protein